MKRILAAIVLAGLGATFLPATANAAIPTRGRTGCWVLGTCEGGTWSGTPTVKPGKATPPNYNGRKVAFYR